MNDFIKTVNFGVNPDGNCAKCDCELINDRFNIYCLAFDRQKIVKYGKRIQCPDCVEFLIREKSKIKCSRCEHVGDYPDWGCTVGGDTENSVDCKQFVKNN